MFKNCLALGMRACAVGLLSLGFVNASAADEGVKLPAIILNCDDQDGYSNLDQRLSDMVISTIKVKDAANSTYYCAMQWGLSHVKDDGTVETEECGYTGLQQLDNGKRIAIFSNWNPKVRWNGEAIASSSSKFIGDGTVTITVGNETLKTFDRSWDKLKGDYVYCFSNDGIVRFYTYENGTEPSVRVENNQVIASDNMELLFQSTESTVISYEQANEISYGIQPFSGEGRGLQSFYNLDWNTDSWYTFVTKFWQDGDNTKIGLWVLDHSGEKWHHFLTMIYPERNVYATSSFGSFLETFAVTDGSVRSMYAAPRFARLLSGEYYYKGNGYVYASGSGPEFHENYVARKENATYFIQAGGTEDDHSELDRRQTIEYETFTSADYALEGLRFFSPITVESIAYENGSLVWEVASDKAPQFSYEYKVSKIIRTDDQLYFEPVFEGSAIDPDCRSKEIDLYSLAPGQYDVQLTLYDVAGNKYTTAFPWNVEEVEENSCVELMNGFTAQYGSLLVDVPIEHNNTDVDLRIEDAEGNVVSQFTSPMSVGYGQNSAVLQLNTQNLSVTGEYHFTATVDDKACKSKFSVINGVYDGDEPVADNVQGIKYIYANWSSAVLGFEALEEADAVVSISSIWGWTAKTETIHLQKGLNSYEINCNGLSVGQTFSVKVVVNGATYSEMFIVK